jgi:hypothetical protein
MGIVTGTLTREPVDVVWWGDPDVKVPDNLKGAGWVNADDCLTVEAGADVVTIRSLEEDGKTRYDDTHDKRGSGSARIFALVSGIVAVKAKGKKTNARKWAGALSTRHRPIAEWLVLRILAETSGHDVADYYATARLAHEVYDDTEGAADAGDEAVKSDAG